jgi:CubicO group peptidase (beta-lactamase class C family)
MAALLKKEDLLAKPGLNYRYSNPGYALLAVVVERVSGKQFGEFLEQEIFEPLGMHNTFVYDSPAKKNARAAVGHGAFGQADDGGPTEIPGDGGIYSTVDDLLKSDQALYTNKLVHSLALSQVWRPNEGRRAADGCRNPTSISTTGQRCGMKILSPLESSASFRPLRIFVARRQIDPFFQLLRPQSSRYFFTVANFRAHGVMCRALQNSLGTA